MEIEIIVFKNSGKYYTSTIVKCGIDIPIYSEEFRELIKNKCPAKIGQGFIIVRDTDTLLKQSFHYISYRYDELFS